MATQRHWVIGRAPDCDLIIQDSAVSAHHCRLTETSQGFLLEDLQSTNGTFVNGQRVSARVQVSRSDRITLGPEVLLPWSGLSQRPAPSRPASSHVPRTTVPDGSPQAVTRIGRAADNEVVLDYPMVSAHHARVTRSGSQMWIEDLGSTNGTAIGHPEQKIARAGLSDKDVVYFGSLRVPASRLLQQGLALGENPHQTVTLPDRALVFGRDPGCDQVLNSPAISRQHARLSRSGNGFTLEDLGSSNGTFVNGHRISGTVEVLPGDIIALGTYTFTLTDSRQLEKRDYRGNMTIEARNVRVEVPARCLLDQVSLTIFPTELVALMGPSGAGKTTLMNALNGYTPPSSGEVLLNGRSLYANYAQFGPHLGYVPQDDIIHRDLTVSQALYFSARLRLPADYRKEDIQDRIRRMLKELGLEGTENVLIGSPEKKGISGGQRKRVNLAMELLTDPQVLFLDEPTSGLSSEDALTVLKLLRQLADTGKIILLTIHQPGLDAFRLVDHLALVSRESASADPGTLVYYGPAYPDAVQFFNPDGVANARPGVDPSPDEILRGLTQLKTAAWAERYRRSPYQREYVVERAGKQVGDPAQGVPEHGRVFGLAQWWTLVARCTAIKIKDSRNTAILLAQAPIIALLMVLVFGKEAKQAPTVENWGEIAKAVGITSFLLPLAALWFGCSNVVREIVGEWAIYNRERMINLKIPSYVASKFTVLGGVCLVQCALLLGITHWGCGLKAPWVATYLLLVLVALVGVALGLTLSSVAKTSEGAIALLPIVLLPMVILGGVMQPVHNMHPVGQWISAIVPSRWAFEGTLLLESDYHPVYLVSKPSVPAGVRGSPGAIPTPVMPEVKVQDERTSDSQDMAENYFPKDGERQRVAVSVSILGGLLIGIVAAIHLILRMRDVH